MFSSRHAILVFALLSLAACKSRGRGKCDNEAVAALAARLDAAEPEARPELLGEGLAKTCELPVFFSHWIALMNRERGLPFLSDEVLDHQREVFTRLCPTLGEQSAPFADTPWALRDAKLYDSCELGQLGVISREDYIRYQQASTATWAGYQWLREQGVKQEAAASIIRALLVLERRGDVELSMARGLRAPKVEGATLPREGLESVISMSTSELLFDAEQLASLDDGRLEPHVVQGHVIRPLFEKLDEQLDKQRLADEAKGLPSEPYVILAIDGRVPYVSVQDLIYTGDRAGVARFGLLADLGAWIHEPLPFEVARYQMSRDGPDDDGLALMVTIDAEGFAVRDQADAGTELEHIGDNVAILATRADEHTVEHPEARVAAISPAGDVEVETLARAIVALRGPRCRTHVTDSDDCRLPIVVLLASGLRRYDPRPPPADGAPRGAPRVAPTGGSIAVDRP